MSFFFLSTSTSSCTPLPSFLFFSPLFFSRFDRTGNEGEAESAESESESGLGIERISVNFNFDFFSDFNRIDSDSSSNSDTLVLRFPSSNMLRLLFLFNFFNFFILINNFENAFSSLSTAIAWAIVVSGERGEAD